MRKLLSILIFVGAFPVHSADEHVKGLPKTKVPRLMSGNLKITLER